MPMSLQLLAGRIACLEESTAYKDFPGQEHQCLNTVRHDFPLMHQSSQGSLRFEAMLEYHALVLSVFRFLTRGRRQPRK